MEKPDHTAADCLFLATLVTASLALYAGKLGFYADDWSWLGHLSRSADQSLLGLFGVLDSDLSRMRPVQNLYAAALYRAFGAHPLGHHLVNSAVFVSIAPLFYLTLRELHQPRAVALAVPAVYLLLPNYSTDRFWYAGFAIPLSVLLYFLSSYADLRALRATGPWRWRWKALSLLGLLGSVLAYEVVLPLFLLNIAVLWLGRGRFGLTPGLRLSAAEKAGLFGSNVTVLLLVVLFKVFSTTRMANLAGLADHLSWLQLMPRLALEVHFGDHGILLPRAVWRVIRDHRDPVVLLLGGATGLLTFWHLYRALTRSPATLRGAAYQLKLMAWGLAIFALGYAVFTTNYNVEFSATGLANRTAIAATIGVACVWVGIIGLLSAPWRSPAARALVFSGGTGLLCASGAVLNNTLASFWAAAYEQEQAILADIRQRFPTLPTGTTLLLDGVCPYLGPAVVFESNWDLAGALLLHYGDRRLRADVVTPKLRVRQDGVSTSIYGVESVYTFDRLLVYHFGKKLGQWLRNAEQASEYFRASNPDLNAECPGKEGHGAPVW